ncbi:hypothetical protein [Blastococcus brunescens]|uniref:Uncharacterized protein n=1 Tax=Blastococcus brunescens TaxID=1564165 RepID=A0ABZ1AX56_9ACTN|nr:hypothetical protein [Blastococcus sp. BMG 8361]WRL61973.1 hypothetical protein U6N30_17995 [Blastococcus sp. BMG 8361]
MADGVPREPGLHRGTAGPAPVRPSDIADRRSENPVPAVYRSLDLDPTSLPLPEGLLLPLLHLAYPLGALGILGPLAVVVHRLRRATGDDRRRMRWLLWAAVVDALVMVAALFFPSTTVSIDLAVAIGLTGLAVTLGILRPRAVDIDRLLGGTLVYGGLAVGVVVLDLAVLAAAGALLGEGFGEQNAVPLALLLVAGVYGPLRAPLWRFVRRWVLGEREDPYRVVSGLAERLERSDDADEQLVAVAAAVAEAFRSPTWASRSTRWVAGSWSPSTAGGRPPSRPCPSPTAVPRSAGCCSPETASARSW